MTDTTYYIKRKTDDRIARIIIEDATEDEDDPWKPLEAMPITWDLVDESMTFFDTPDHPDRWEETFYASEDSECAAWLQLAEPSEPETFVITVVRPTDGAVANVELKESEDGGVWTALADALPNAYDMIEDDEVIMGEHPRAVEWFEEGDDYSLCEWLQNAVVRLEDEHGNLVWKREGRPDELIGKAKDEACKRANAGGVDPWEAQYILKIGDEVIWDYHEDVEVAFADHYEGDLADDHGCAVSIEADEVDGIASVTWYPRDGSAARAMDISLNPGDYNKIRLGADPVAEGWEDGFGSVVSFDNAEEASE